jgi:hypothetical protein
MNKELIKTHWNLFLLSGAISLVAAIAILRSASEESPLLWIGALLSVVSGVSLVFGLYGAIQQKQPADERFILHRLKATRFALILGLVAIGAFLIFDAIANEVVRYDLLTILGTVTVGKLGGMAYYKLRQ